MHKYNGEKDVLQKIYGSEYIDKVMPGHYPETTTKKRPAFKLPFTLDVALFYLKERLILDQVIREMTFATLGMALFLWMKLSGRMDAMAGLGLILSGIILFSVFYNLFKASFYCLTPGVLCLVSGYVMLKTGWHLPYLKFVTLHHLNGLIAIGAFFSALSLFRSNN